MLLCGRVQGATLSPSVVTEFLPQASEGYGWCDRPGDGCGLSPTSSINDAPPASFYTWWQEKLSWQSWVAGSLYFRLTLLSHALSCYHVLLHSEHMGGPLHIMHNTASLVE